MLGVGVIVKNLPTVSFAGFIAMIALLKIVRWIAYSH
jgi:hypothetical protein